MSKTDNDKWKCVPENPVKDEDGFYVYQLVRCESVINCKSRRKNRDELKAEISVALRRLNSVQL